MKRISLFLIMFIVLMMTPVFGATTITNFNVTHNGSQGVLLDNDYLWQDFTINVTTNGDANCSYKINYSDSGLEKIAETSLLGDITTNHLRNITYGAAFEVAKDYTINISCWNSTNASDSATSQKTVKADLNCGDQLNNSWTLGHNLTTCSTDGILIDTSNVNLNCADFSIKGDGTSYKHGINADASTANKNNITIRNCNITGFSGNIIIKNFENVTITDNFIGAPDRFTIEHPYSASVYIEGAESGSGTIENNIIKSNKSIVVSANDVTIQNNSINNEVFGIYSVNGIFGIKVLNDTSNIIIKNNTINNYNDTSTGFGINLSTGITNLKIYSNNITNNRIGVYAAEAYSLNYSTAGNYWGRGVCPGFIPGTDASAGSIDSYAYEDDLMTDEACGCGDEIEGNATLYHDYSCAGGTGFIMNTNNTILNCNGKNISDSVGTGTGILNGANYSIITSCILENWKIGINETRTINNTITANNITNSDGAGTSAGAIALGNTYNTTITANTINNNGQGIYLLGTVGATIVQNNIYNNNVGTGSGFSLYDEYIIGTIALNVTNNYWGHNTCSLYAYNVDTNSPNVIDLSAVSVANNWTSTIDCRNASLYPGFTGVALKLYDGNDTGAVAPVYDYYYAGGPGSSKTYLTNSSNWMSHNGYFNPMYKFMGIFVNPGKDLIYDINYTPQNFNLSNITLMTDTLNDSYTFTYTNTSGPMGAAGTYRLNLSGYTVNVSNEGSNGSEGIQSLDLKWYFIENTGEARIFMTAATYNFTPQSQMSWVNGSSTNWTSIIDFTDVSNFVIETLANPGGKIEFMESLNLMDVEFINALANFADYVGLDSDNMSIDSEIMGPLNKSANITFYGFNSTLNATEIGDRLLMDGELCPGTVCANYSYVGENFSVVVQHWTDYTIDETAPVVSASGPTGTITTAATTLTVTTDEAATCKYGTTDLAYASLPSTMSGSTTAHTQALTGLSNGAKTYYVRCQDAFGNNMTTSAAITFTIDVSSSSSSSGSNYGSVNPLAARTSARAWETLSIGTTEVPVSNPNIPIDSIELKIVGEQKNSKLEVIGHSSKPSAAEETSTKTYQYLEIKKTNIDEEGIESAKISFKVEKSWLIAQGVSEDSIALFRFVDEWIELETTKTSEDGTYVYFEATTPGFSYFAIGEKATVETDTSSTEQEQDIVETTDETLNTANENLETQSNSNNEERESSEEEMNSKSKKYWILVALVLCVFAGIAYLLKASKK